MELTYPKEEKLKSRKTIAAIFQSGYSVAKYPLRLAFVRLEQDAPDSGKIKFGVSVSKKYFRKSVDRNRIKRLLREAYRLNKHILQKGLLKNYAFMILHQSKEMPDFETINAKTVLLFEKFKQSTEQNDLPEI